MSTRADGGRIVLTAGGACRGWLAQLSCWGVLRLLAWLRSLARAGTEPAVTPDQVLATAVNE